MPTVDLVVETPASTSIRARQVSSMFDCPVTDKSRREWRFDFPYDAEPWNVGLIVGPSGSGKSSVMRRVFGEPVKHEWAAPSVIDDVRADSVQSIAEAFSSVGFGTIPAWMRPFATLSNGEQFRVDLARRLLEQSDPIVVDEFTSVVDRQVAQVGSHAVQKYVRRTGRMQTPQFVTRYTCDDQERSAMRGAPRADLESFFTSCDEFGPWLSNG